MSHALFSDTGESHRYACPPVIVSLCKQIASLAIRDFTERPLIRDHFTTPPGSVRQLLSEQSGGIVPGRHWHLARFWSRTSQAPSGQGPCVCRMWHTPPYGTVQRRLLQASTWNQHFEGLRNVEHHSFLFLSNPSTSLTDHDSVLAYRNSLQPFLPLSWCKPCCCTYIPSYGSSYKVGCASRATSASYLTGYCLAVS